MEALYTGGVFHSFLDLYRWNTHILIDDSLFKFFSQGSGPTMHNHFPGCMHFQRDLIQVQGCHVINDNMKMRVCFNRDMQML